MNDYQNFETFVKDLQRFKKTSAYSWCKERQHITQESLNKKKVMLTEINQYDSQDPLSLISNEYKNRVYNRTLFEVELNDIKEMTFNHDYILALIEKCEHNERIRTIIENYLTYIVELNFEPIISSLSKLNTIEENVVESCMMTKKTKDKIFLFKKNYLYISAKFLLIKQKKKNIEKLKTIAKNKIFSWKHGIDEFEQLIASNLLLDSYIKLNAISEQMKKSTIIKNLSIFNLLNAKVRDKMKILYVHSDRIYANIFLAKNENYRELFMFNISICNLDEYLNKFIHVFKDSVFSIIKETFYSYSEDKFISKEDIKKLKDLNKFFKMEENKFITCINQTIQNLIKICENYIFYIECHKKLTFENEYYSKLNSKFLSDIETNKKRVYEIIEKKLTKLYNLFKLIIKELTTKNLIYFTFFNSISLDYLNFLFDVNYSKHLKLHIKSVVSENLKVQNLNTIKKIGILLEGDLWSKVSLPNDHRCFEIEKVKEMVPSLLKPCINIFNEDDFLNKANIKQHYSRLIDINNYLTNNFNYEAIPSKEIKLVFNEINMRNILISSSTYNLLKSFHIFVLFFNYFNSITFDIFLQLFQNVDFYIFCSMRMLAPKSLFKKLFEEFNNEELKKKSNGIFSNKIENIVDTLFFQKTNKFLKSFIEKTKKFIEITFNCKVDLYSNDSKENDDINNFNDFQLPRLNFQLQSNDSNSYYLIIESIVWFESIKSLVRILRKMRVFVSNIQLEFQKNSIMDFLNNYKAILDELQIFIFKPLCDNIFKFDNVIMNKVLSVKWDQNDSDIDTMFTEANNFINQIFQEICEKYEKLDILSKNSLNEKAKRRFLKVVMIYFKEKLLETFSKIKKCSTFGRSIMLKDMKFLKSKIEGKFGINEFNEIFNYIDNYINNWYSNENELISYIKEKVSIFINKQINYKYLAGILNTGPAFVKLNKQQKKDYQNKLEDLYLQLLDN